MAGEIFENESPIAALKLPHGRALSKRRIRLFGAAGRYPKSDYSYGRSLYIIEEDIAFSVVTIHDEARHGLTYEHHSEMEYLSLEELRFYGAITLARRADTGINSLYPMPQHIDISVHPRRERDELLEIARLFAKLFPKDHYTLKGVEIPLAMGGRGYEVTDTALDSKVANSIMRNLRLDDFLAIRGLGALMKSDMLLTHHAFGDAALNFMHIALEASYQMVLRHLRAAGIKKPTAYDAGKFVDDVFENSVSSGKYFQEYYEDRVKAVHPTNKFGIFPFAPSSADDLYGLRPDLVAVFVMLISGHSWKGLWR